MWSVGDLAFTQLVFQGITELVVGWSLHFFEPPAQRKTVCLSVVNVFSGKPCYFPSVLGRSWLGDGGHPVSTKLDLGLLVDTFLLKLCATSIRHSPSPSSLAPIKSRMETFWYWLTQIHLENGL